MVPETQKRPASLPAILAILSCRSLVAWSSCRSGPRFVRRRLAWGWKRRLARSTAPRKGEGTYAVDVVAARSTAHEVKHLLGRHGDRVTARWGGRVDGVPRETGRGQHAVPLRRSPARAGAAQRHRRQYRECKACDSGPAGAAPRGPRQAMKESLAEVKRRRRPRAELTCGSRAGSWRREQRSAESGRPWSSWLAGLE